MKKILLLLSIISFTYSISAQQCDGTLPVYEDFGNSSEVSLCWNFIDNDNDGHNWYVANLSGNNGLISESYTTSTGYLTPDNWAITYAIDLTNVNPSSNVLLTWRVRASSWSFDKERYTVYAASGNQIADFTSSSVSVFEDLDNSDASGIWASRSLNLSSLAGNTIYIAFRHHLSANQRDIDIDDIMISASALSVEDFNKENFNYYYNTNSKTLTLKSSNKPISSVKIYNLLGQKTFSKTSTNTTENIDLSSMTNGVYIAQIEIDNTFKSIKFLKQ